MTAPASRLLAALIGVAMATGCAKPNPANIALRRQVQELETVVAELRTARQVDQNTIRKLESDRPTVPTLPAERLAALFTAHGIALGRLTGGADFDSKKPGDEGLKIYLTPTDDTGDDVKAAGSVTVETFDLSAGDVRIGKWEFSAVDARKLWNGAGLLYEYVLPCAWQSAPPAHEQLTIKVTFTDELTGRVFSAQKAVTVRLHG
ncbi:MAG: hypothetical protein H7144_14905 [Burkholderiales bacterium]|nr:hypothetical protein [Phycisphaerae bacterium]